jgi:hypothetical protein
MPMLQRGELLAEREIPEEEAPTRPEEANLRSEDLPAPYFTTRLLA